MDWETIQTIRELAAGNALQYGKCEINAVLGKLLADHPELRIKAKELIPEINEVLAEINKLPKAELEKLASRQRADKRVRKQKLPDLPHVHGKVILRFAPNPSGPLHIGHARTALLNDEYAKMYGGEVVLRFEDTDPKRVMPGAYEMIREDMKWLGAECHREVIQSRRLPVYRDIATRLIKQGAAYLCSCGQTKFKEYKERGEACPCRGLSVSENMARWEEMKEFKGNLAVMLKTYIAHQNPALRDFPIMRIIKKEHPLTGRKKDIYPLMNFSVTIDDHFCHVTHVIRGKDHIVNTQRQMFLYDYLGWKPPVFIHNGLMRTKGINLKTSLIKKGIEAGEYTGWDDARLATIGALRRRGIRPEAIRNMIIAMGCSEVDTTFEWANLYGENRKIIEPLSNRYFFVPEPEEVWVKGILPDITRVKVQLHPDFPERGFREIAIKRDNRGETRLFIAKKDAATLKKGENIRLKNFCNVKITGLNPLTAEYTPGKDLKTEKKIQWLPEDVIGCEVLGPQGRVAGFCEVNCSKLKAGDEIQFERFGFVQVDKVDDSGIVCYYTHD